MLIDANTFAEQYIPKMENSIKTNIARRLKRPNLIFQDTTSKNLYEDTRVDEASGTMREMVDGSETPATTVNTGYVKRLRQRKFGMSIQYTEFAWKTANPDLLKKITATGATAPDELLRRREAAYLELGDLAIASVPKNLNVPIIDTLAADGQPIFSTAHTFKSTALVTYSNKTASFEALTGDTLYGWVNQVRNWRNNLDELLEIRPKKLVVGFTNHKKAVELIKSTDDSETTNRSTNATKEHGLSLELYERMQSPSECFLITDAENDFRRKFLYKPETDKDYNKDTKVHKIIVTMAFMDGVGDPRAVFANKL